MGRIRHLRCVILMCGIILAVHILWSQVPQTISYQGLLTNAGGNPIADGNYVISFRLYDQADSGTPLWTETQTVSTANGLFNVILGRVDPLDLPFDKPYWLGMAVGGGAELTPRMELTASAYSLNARSVADSAITDRKIADGSTVRSINTLKDDILLVGGNNVTITDSDHTLTISATAAGGSRHSLDAADGDPADALYLDDEGNVGIDTTNPETRLFINNGQLSIYGGADRPSVLTLRPSGAGTRWNLGNAYNGAFAIQSGNMIQANNTTSWSDSPFIIQPGGNIGIKTLAPGSPLQVHGFIHSSKDGFKFPDGTVQTTAADTATGDTHSLDAADGNPADVVYVDNEGRVGIGTTQPTKIMDINGQIGLRGGDFGNPGIWLKNTAGIDEWFMGKTNQGGRDQIGFYRNAWQMVIQSNNRVGIGTIDPLFSLHVENEIPNDDDPAIFGRHDTTDYYGTGVKGVGGFAGVVGLVVPSGTEAYYGVLGDASGDDGIKFGVFGKAIGARNTKCGVYGYASGNEGTNYGVVGTAVGSASTNWAGYFYGDVHVTGTLSKGAGAFKIDHPLDPENRYLYHSFVESPDMMNIYNGNVILDDRGEAVVVLPDWFDALNKDFRYQLTCIGGFAQIYIAQEISNNRFMIAGGNPGLKVSWQITGIRKDAYAEAHRIPVEQDKKGEERGTYLHPKALGVDETLRTGYKNIENSEKYQ